MYRQNNVRIVLARAELYQSISTRAEFCQPERRFASKRPEKVRNAKSHSSQQWLRRQMKDPYVIKARENDYRARSAFKLIEIDQKLRILQPGMTVVECGAAPGSWTQVLVERVNCLQSQPNIPIGTVVAFDRDYMTPLNGATVIPDADLREPSTREKVVEALGRPHSAHLVISDMAPNATGTHRLDEERMYILLEELLEFSVSQLLRPNGNFLCKFWLGTLFRDFKSRLEMHFNSVRVYKPPASRGDSSESYVLAEKLKASNNSLYS